MLRNYFRTAWRNLINNKRYSLLNITGLTVGLAVGLLILLWVNDELSYDQFHRKSAQIYRINTKIGTGISTGVYPVVQAPIAPLGLKEVPGIQQAVRITENYDYAVFKYQDKVLEAGPMVFADPSFFSVFDFHLLKGDVQHPFPDAQSVILSRAAAKKFFGAEDPMGKTLLADNKYTFTVSGVVENFPQNTFLEADMLFSTELYKKRYDGTGFRKSLDEDWGNYKWNVYLQVQPGVSLRSVEDGLTKINIRHQPDLKPIDVGAYQLQALTSTHLYAPDGTATVMQTVKIFSIVALFILLIACINYVNLSTARAVLRSREVSIRKIIGAARRQLMIQFVIETMLYFTIALCLAFGLMALLMPLYNNISGKQIHLNLADPRLWTVIGATVTLTLIASSAYPALLLSSFKPLMALKGKLSFGVGSTAFRKVLVVCQFAFSAALIIGTLVINQQLNFIRKKELGYDKSHVFTLNMRNMNTHYDAVKAELMKEPAITGVTAATGNIINVPGATLDINWDGKDPDMSYFIHATGIDKDFFPFFRLKMATGQNFTGSAADSAHFILNETAVKEAGIKDPIGKRITFSGTTGTIIGVAKDFHFMSLRMKIQPFIFYYQPVSNRLLVRTSGRNAPQAIKAVEKVWQQYNAGFPMQYTFLDESYDKLYRSEERTGKLFDLFTIIAIFISCLGLFGLSTYAAHAKVKEIGIRKVLGASVMNITAMLSKDFLALVMLSVMIAGPIAWWAMHAWLNDFAYQGNIQWWWIFAITGISTLGVTILTVSFQSVRAALANPIKSLKAE